MRGSLRPEGRSCHWQAGRFAPPLRKPIGEGQEARNRLASPLTVKICEGAALWRPKNVLPRPPKKADWK